MKPAPPVTRMTSSCMTVGKARIGKELGNLAKPGQRAIPLRQNRVLGIDRPGDADLGVIPGDAALRLRIVIGGYLVSDLAVGLERAIAMREALRHVNLLPVLCAEHHRCVTAESRRAGADVDSNIENAPARARSFAWAQGPI